MDNQADIRELIDRQRIWECLLRYTRGMDRLDRDLVLSAYHPGGKEDHGALIAPAEQFVDIVLEHHRAGEIVTQHIMNNHGCEIDGDVAHAETYVTCYSVTLDNKASLSFGRFADRLEKRDGRSGITDRVSLRTGASELSDYRGADGHVLLPESLGESRRDRRDPSYVRPLAVVLPA
jgi:hypothetical protein